MTCVWAVLFLLWMSVSSVSAEIIDPAEQEPIGPTYMGDLISHWAFDELSGTVASDRWGDNNGTLRGNPTWRPGDGKIGGALEFDGVGDYVEIVGYKGVSGWTPRTVTAWVRVESDSPGLSIVRWGTLAVNGGLWSNVINADGKLRAAVLGGSVVGDTDIGDNTWHHVAVVLPNKEDVKVEDILLYVDGEQEDTTITYGTQAIDTGIDMNVLISLDGSVGLLDDVRIYNCALSEEEIGTLDIPRVQFVQSTSSVMEGDSVNIDVVLNMALGATATVNYTTTDNNADSADYSPHLDAGILTFNPGVTSQPISFTITDDTSAELKEAFTVTLSNPSGPGLVLGLAEHRCVIQASEQPLKVIFAAGQSNMVGFGSNDQLPYITSSLLATDVQGDLPYPSILAETRQDVIMDVEADSHKGIGYLEPGWGYYGGAFGPELSFGHLAGPWVDQKVLIFKRCQGGSTLSWPDNSNGYWLSPTASARRGEPVGNHYTNLVDDFNARIANLEGLPGYDGGGYEIAGFLWLQGESDSMDMFRVEQYQENLLDLISDLRNDLNAPDMPFMIARIHAGPPKSPWTYASLIWEAELYADDNVVNVASFATSDLNPGYHYQENGPLPQSADYVTMGARFAHITMPYLSNGLVVSMDMEDNYGFYGSPMGDPAFVGDAPRSSKALEFDGDDSVELQDFAGVVGMRSRTCATWIKTSADGQIMSWGGDGAGEKWQISIQSGHLYVDVGSGHIESSVSITDGEWHHVAVVSEVVEVGSPLAGQQLTDNINLYVDTKFDSGSTFVSQSIATADVGNVMIGDGFVGVLDDVKIFDIALNASEVAMLAGVPFSPVDGDLDLNGRVNLADFAYLAAHWLETDCDVIDNFCSGADLDRMGDVGLGDLLVLTGNWLEGVPRPLARWRLDESSGTVASDSVGGNDGTLNGDPTWRPSDGKIGGALEFDGNGDYVEVEGYKGVSGSKPRTVTAWVRTESDASSLSIVRWGTLAINGGLWSNVIGADGKLKAAVLGGSVVGVTDIDDDTWHHVAIVLPDKENVKVEDILLYVDGEQEDTTISFGSQTIDTGVDMNVLISLDGSTGLLDDVRIYNCALSTKEIRTLAGFPPELVAHWKLDESSGTVANDSSGKGNHGSLNGDPTWWPSDGKIGGALEFDGAGDYVEVEGYKGVSGLKPRSVTAWVRTESNGSGLSIVRWGTLAINGALWSNVITADGKLRAAVVGGSVVGVTDIDDDTWHHVAIVLPDKEDVKVEDILLYVDGEQEDTTISFGSQTIDTGVDMNVLISLDGSTGLLDDVRIYNYALSEDEIGSLAGVL